MASFYIAFEDDMIIYEDLNMKVLILYADGFEDVEALATRDVLVRAGFEVCDVKISDNEQLVVSSHKVALYGLKSLKEVTFNEFDALIIPGGSRGVMNLLNSEDTIRAVKHFYHSNKYVCAICAGPMVLSKAGVLAEHIYTCYPGCEKGLLGTYTGKEIEVSGKIITARSMMYSIPFGLKIIEVLGSKELSEKINRQISGLK